MGRGVRNNNNFAFLWKSGALADLNTLISVTGVTSSPELQARYIRRQMQIADAAKLVGVFQITFTDIDLSSYPVPPGSILPQDARARRLRRSAIRSP